MTDILIRKGYTFGLYHILAPMLTGCAFGLAAVVDDRAQAMRAAGQGVMMLAITIYAFHLKDRPVTECPPVRFPASSLVLISLFTIGAIIWGVARADAAGMIIALGIPAIIVGLGRYLSSPKGIAWRESVKTM